MPLQIRRGTSAEKATLASPPVAGELIWITDEARLYIGDGVTLAGDLSPVTGYSDDNAKDAAADIFTAGSHSGISFSYDGSTSINATVSYPALLQNLNTNGFDISGSGNINITGSIIATSFVGDYKGSISADDSTLLVDALNGAINLSGTVKGNIIPDQTETHDIGSVANKFDNIYLSATGLNVGTANISSTGSVINLPAGSTVGGIDIGTAVGQGVVEGSNYNINIVADDSTIMLNAATQQITAPNGFVGNLIGNVTGNVTGSMQGLVIAGAGSSLYGELVGSVFSDNSTLLIDGINGDAYFSDLTAQMFTNGTLTIDNNNLTVNGTDIIEIGASDGTNPNTLVFPDEQGTYMLDSKSLAGSIFSISKIGFSAYKDSITSPSAPVPGDFSGAIIGQMYETLSASLVTTGGFVLGTDNNEAIASNTVKGKMSIITNGGTGSSPSLKFCTFDSSGRFAVNQLDAQATLDVNGDAIIRGGLVADVTGSLFSDTSTMLIDGTDGKLIVNNFNFIGETGNSPVDTGTVDSWLEIAVNGTTKYIPLYD